MFNFDIWTDNCNMYTRYNKQQFVHAIVIQLVTPLQSESITIKRILNLFMLSMRMKAFCIQTSCTCCKHPYNTLCPWFPSLTVNKSMLSDTLPSGVHDLSDTHRLSSRGMVSLDQLFIHGSFNRFPFWGLNMSHEKLKQQWYFNQRNFENGITFYSTLCKHRYDQI